MARRKGRRLAAGALALPAAWAVALAAACGGGGPAPDAGDRAEGPGGAADARAPAVEACALLTAAEIEDATGVRPGEPAANETPAGAELPTCRWPAADGSEFQIAHLLVTRSAYGGFDEFVEDTRAQMGREYVESLHEIEGIGDFAVWMGEDFAGGILQVYEGDRMVQIAVAPAEGRDAVEVSKELARRALSRL